ncbi:MAG: DUF5615 family PIN-like protein [Chloroflexi bacterium]|nr:DUF5615 family PIN-like protein [Chloroflexota bacterium]
MNFVADESVDQQIVARLRRDSHIVLYVAEMEPGISDDDVLSLANREGAPLITADKDFGELVFRLGHISSGVILIRLAGLPQSGKANAVSRAIKEHTKELPQAFTVITPGIVRIRRSSP